MAEMMPLHDGDDPPQATTKSQTQISPEPQQDGAKQSSASLGNEPERRDSQTERYRQELLAAHAKATGAESKMGTQTRRATEGAAVRRRMTQGLAKSGDLTTQMSMAHLDQTGKAKAKELLLQPDDEPFIYNHVGLTVEEAKKLFDQYGPNELPDRKEPDWKIIGQSLIQPMPCMIWAAAIIEAAIQNWIDMVILLFIQFANCSIGFYETKKAGNAVAALKQCLRPRAYVKRRSSEEDKQAKFVEIDASLLVPGDLVQIIAGQNIPADCRLNHGTIDVDQAALTGESFPVTMTAGNDSDPKSPRPKMGSGCVKAKWRPRWSSLVKIQSWVKLRSCFKEGKSVRTWTSS